MLQRDKKELQKHRANNKRTLAVCVFKWMQDPKPEDFNQAHITKEDVKKAWTNPRTKKTISDEKAELIAQVVNHSNLGDHLNDSRTLSNFFGQLAHESNYGRATDEKLNYGLKNLFKFKYYQRHPDEARHDVKLHGKEKFMAIANKAYAYRNGNGGVESGDGYRFRGRGYIQLTGRAHYAEFTKWYKEHYGEDVDFIAHPELVAEGKYAIISAIFYWDKNKVYVPAKKNDMQGVTDLINKGTDSRQKRVELTKSIQQQKIFENSEKINRQNYYRALLLKNRMPACQLPPSYLIKGPLGLWFIDAEQDSSPLIIDLDGDGAKSISLNDSSVFFDLDNDGFAEKTAWVGPHDGLLVRDLNHNGIIDNGSELFGNHTFCADGQLAHNGFEALQSYQDGGGLLTASSSPKLWKELMIWQDRNSNGRTDQGELTPLSATGIKSINLNYRLSSWRDGADNSHRQRLWDRSQAIAMREVLCIYNRSTINFIGNSPVIRNTFLKKIFTIKNIRYKISSAMLIK